MRQLSQRPTKTSSRLIPVTSQDNYLKKTDCRLILVTSQENYLSFAGQRLIPKIRQDNYLLDHHEATLHQFLLSKMKFYTDSSWGNPTQVPPFQIRFYTDSSWSNPTQVPSSFPDAVSHELIIEATLSMFLLTPRYSSDTDAILILIHIQLSDIVQIRSRHRCHSDTHSDSTVRYNSDML